jgi:hypothetical protein
MRTPETETHNGLGGVARQVAEHASTLARLELELAQLELKSKATSLGLGIGLGVGAAVFGLLMLGFAFAAVAAAFDTFLSTWLALLITTGILAALAGVLALLALGRISRGAPPVPEQAIQEARMTTNVLKR